MDPELPISESPKVEPTPTDPPAADPPKGEPESVKADAAQGDEAKPEDPPKKEKTPEEREIARLRRRVDNLTRRLYQGQPLQSQEIGDTNRPEQADSEPVSLSRAELDALIESKAKELAPTIRQQQDEIEHRKGIVSKLEKTWGKDKFDEIASELDEALGGLADRSGRPKPATEAIFASDAPVALIEYLADPANTEQAEALSRMSAVQAGRTVAKLDAQLAAASAKPKPKVSNAPVPIEALRGGGPINTAPHPTDTKAWIRYQNELERKGAQH